jgi:GT2 family glycosyltransferase
VRARRAGWQVWFEPTAVATHTLGGSSQKNELPLMVESYRSMYRFYETYYPRSWSTTARIITRAAMLLRVMSLPFRRRRSRARLAAYREIARL